MMLSEYQGVADQAIPKSDGWSAVPLRSAGGAPHVGYGGRLRDVEDTALAGRCPSSMAMAEEIRAESGLPLLGLVRFMILQPGASIAPHREIFTGHVVRFHVCVAGSGTLTIDGAEVPVGGRPVRVPIKRRHEARNDGQVPRVHLVVDVGSNMAVYVGSEAA